MVSEPLFVSFNKFILMFSFQDCVASGLCFRSLQQLREGSFVLHRFAIDLLVLYGGDYFASFRSGFLSSRLSMSFTLEELWFASFFFLSYIMKENFSCTFFLYVKFHLWKLMSDLKVVRVVSLPNSREYRIIVKICGSFGVSLVMSVRLRI